MTAKRDKFSKFLWIGACSLNIFSLGVIGYNTLLSQNETYQQINGVIHKIENKLSSKQENKKDVQYRQWIEEDMNFIKSLHSDDNEFTEKLNQLPIYFIQKQTFLDKISHHLLESKIRTSDKNEIDYYRNNLMTNEGFNNFVNTYYNEDGKIKSASVFMGTERFDKSEQGTFTSNLQEAFSGNKRHTIDFVFFHEMGHFISKQMKNSHGNVEDQEIKLRYKTFESKQRKPITDLDKKIIQNQYTESIGDLIGLQLFLSKYKNYKDVNTLIDCIVATRLANSDDNEHMNAAALVTFKEDMKKYGVPSTLKEMVDKAQDFALKNTEYYSSIKLSHMDNSYSEVKLTKDGISHNNREHIMRQITKIRINHILSIDTKENKKHL